jgi:drug/metabolite transporter (DMT)-like permease
MPDMERHRPSGRSRLGFGLAFTTMALWGVLPLALKITLASMDALTITWYRFVAATLLLGLGLAYQGRLPHFGALGRSGWALLVVATLFLAANYVFYLLGLHHTTPANSQVLIQLAPVLLALGGLWVFEERFTRVQWLGFAVLLVGVAVFFRDQQHAVAGGAGEYRLGSLLILLAAATWAIYGLAQKQLLRWLPAQGIMVYIYAGCAVVLAPLGSPGEIVALDGLGLAMLVFCSLNTVVAYGTFAEALVHWEASRVGAVLALTPVVTIVATWAARAIWPALMPSPALTVAGALGAALVVVGSLLTAFGQRVVRVPVAVPAPERLADLG